MATRRGRLSLSILVAVLVSGAAPAQTPPSLSPEDLRSLPERRMNLPARKGPKALKGHDRADRRQEWNLYWFGGAPSVDYLDFKNALASQELERRQGPINSDDFQPVASTPATSTLWMNLGPKAQVTSAAFPDIDSGRPTAIVTHPTNPQILYMATSGGGVFKCSNADLASAGDWTWTAITDALPSSSASGNLAVGSLAMSPADPETLFVGLGDDFDTMGRGLYKTVNGGASWTAATGLGNQTATHTILALSGTVILVGGDDGMKRSTDGGSTYSAVSLGGSSTGDVWTIKALSASELICSRQVGTTGTIWYSSDSGASWTQATISGVTPQRISVATSAASSTTAWGICQQAGGYIARGLMKTTDKGHTWTFVAAPDVAGGLFRGRGYQDDLADGQHQDGAQAFYNHGLAVDPADINRVFVGANLNLFATINGGTSWTQLSSWTASGHVYAHADFHTTAWSKTGASALYIGNDGGLAILRDPSLTTIPTGSFTSNGTVNSVPTFIDNRRNKGLSTHLVYSLGSTNAASPADAKSRITLGLQDNGTRVRQGTGAALATSTIFEDRIGGDGFGTLIHPTNGNLMLGTLYYSSVFKSTDGGATSFADSSTGITEAGDYNLSPFAPKLALGATSAPDTVYTFVNTKVYKSLNFGGSWSAMNMTGFSTSQIIRNVNAARTNTNAVAVVTGASGYATYNGGSSWTAFGAFPNTGTSNAMSYVWFDTLNDQVLYAASVMPSATVSHLWRSANGGSTWTAIDRTSGGASNGFPYGIPVHVVQNDPADSAVLFAGTDFGVYRSTDTGATWTAYGQGLPMVAVRDLYIAPNGSFVRAGTFGRGAWELAGSTVQTPPTITTQPVSQTVNAGQTATFSVAASGTAPFTYQWRKNGTAVTGATASSYTTPVTILGDTGSTYSAVVTNAVGSATSSNATLTVTTSTTFFEAEANNTLATANAVGATYTAIQGNLPTVADVDTFALTLAPNQKIAIAMTGPTGLDWDLALKDSAGVNLATSAGGTTTENLSWTNGATAKTVYPQVIVFNTSAGSATPYNLGLTYTGGITDITAPTVSASETGTSGTITLAATAADNVGGSGMARVDFLVDGVLRGTDATSPYSVTLNSVGTLANGAHSLVARAYDVAGNNAPSTAVAFNISNPVSDITAPTVSASETGTSGTITLAATASDNVGGSGMARVDFLVDGVLRGSDATSPYSVALNTVGLLADGAHSLVARAYDVAGNNAPSTAVAFNISNGLNQNEVESNNTTATANTVSTTGTTVTGFISATTDTDYFKVTLAPGATLTATLTPPAASDFDLFIYNTTSTTPIASSEAGTGLVDTASVTNTGTTAITRYIQVKYWSGASTTQSYKLKLTF